MLTTLLSWLVRGRCRGWFDHVVVVGSATLWWLVRPRSCCGWLDDAILLVCPTTLS